MSYSRVKIEPANYGEWQRVSAHTFVTVLGGDRPGTIRVRTPENEVIRYAFPWESLAWANGDWIMIVPELGLMATVEMSDPLGTFYVAVR
jgi:hypothetical protein